jgi:hypothetical protein
MAKRMNFWGVRHAVFSDAEQENGVKRSRTRARMSKLQTPFEGNKI